MTRVSLAPGRNEAPQRGPKTGKGTGDVTTFIGRILRNLWAWMLLAAFAATQPALAAPFAAIVMDARSGEVLYEKNADTRLHPASLTKMMTLYIVFQEIEAGRLSLDTKVTISAHAASQPPSRLGLKKGQKIALRYLIRAAAVKSANDAATAIGELVGGGSEAAFAKRMTKTARALGMRGTTFRNANGLTTEGHLSTARDMTILGRHLFYDFPQYYNIFSRRTADAGMATVRNTNSRFLDGYEGADGIKTGYTVAAGFNLTASAKHGKVRLIATIFGSTSTAARNAKMAELMDLGFGKAKNNVREKKPEAAPLPEDALIAAAEPGPIDTPDVEGGAAKTVRVSGAVTRSLRPKPRPGAGTEEVVVAAVAEEAAPDVPDALAEAIASGVADALAEATAPPPPEGTLEAQVAALESAPEAAPEAVAEATAVVIAEAAPVAAPAPAGSLEAQAAALAAGAAPAETPAPDAETALAALRPQARPVTPAEAAPAPAEAVPEAVAAAEAPAVPEPAPVLEEVVLAEAPAADVPAAEAPSALALAEAAEAPLPVVSAVEEAVAVVVPEAVIPAPAEPARAAPIFEPVDVAEVTPEEAEALVVVTKSTSGERHWGVNVGAYASRSEAERALLKTGLAESATLNEGLKKITEKGGKYRASFLGLSEDQADLACRRLRARGMDCEAIGPA
jgi:D-alanyl-D-alanine carboxypeptidase